MKFDANSAVKSSINGMPQTSKEALSSSIRKFAKENVIIKNQCLLGQGVFAKCYFATVGPNKACLKILRASTCSSFYREANILSGLCHPNVSFLLGVCESVRHKMLILTFHGIGSNSISLHSALVSKKELDLVISVVQWKEIVIGIIAGILYIHNSSILHNDIKEDNILIDYDYNKQLKSVLVDFGKACRDNFGRKYSLSKEEKQYYKIHHPHIAPDVRDGLRVQDKLSDVYSFGRVLSLMNREDVITVPALFSIASECLHYNATLRPTTADLSTFLKNLFVSQH